MKRLLAIPFLLLLLFNMVGYRLYFYYEQQKADLALVASLDKEAYNQEELIMIRVPLSLPYQTDWKDFERVNGEIDVNGETYKYVKRKVENGALILLCLPDHHRARLENAKDAFFSLVNNMQTQLPTKGPVSPGKISFSNILSDFDRLQPTWLLQACSLLDKVFIPYCLVHHIAPTLPPPTHPPQVQKA